MAHNEDLDALADEALDEQFAESGLVLPKKKKKKKRLLADLDPTLIPAGDVRDDALKAIADELDQEAEERATDEEKYRLDPAKFEIENEIASRATSLDVSGAQEHRRYCWARFKCDSGVSQADYKLAQTIGVREIATGKKWQEPIWHVVKGTDQPEALELMQPDNTRRLGDVILLWCKREVYEAIQRVAEQKRKELYGGTRRAAQAFEEKTGIKIATEADMKDPRFEKIAKHAEGMRRHNLSQDDMVRQQLLKQRAAG